MHTLSRCDGSRRRAWPDHVAGKAARDALGLDQGSTLKVELEGSCIVAQERRRRDPRPFKLDGFESTDVAMRAIRAAARPAIRFRTAELTPH